MSTKQINRTVRLKALADALNETKDGGYELIQGENFDSIFNRAVSLVPGIEKDSVSDSQKNAFKKGFMDDRAETYARSTTIEIDGKNVNAFDYFKSKDKKYQVQQMLEELRTKMKSQIKIEGQLLPIPPGFEGTGRGRRSVNPLETLKDLIHSRKS